MIYSLIEFAERRAYENNAPFKYFGYMETVCRALEDCVLGLLPDGKKNLTIEIGPRHYKTELASKCLPAWCLGEIAPDCEFIQTSYAAGLAISNVMAVRQTIAQPWYQALYPTVVVDKEAKDVQHYFRTTSQGACYASGMEGTITGFGAGKAREGFGGAIIIDDPMKAIDARSSTLLEKTVEFYDGTLMSRRNNTKTTPIITIMQRLNDEDLVGYQRRESSDDTYFLSMPALTDDGEPINPVTCSKEDLEKLKNRRPHVFYPQYMQDTTQGSEAGFKRTYWKYYKMLPKVRRVVIYADTAQKEKEQHDYTVFMAVAQGYDNQLYIVDLFREKLESPDLRVQARAFYNKHRSTGKYICTAFKVEDKSSGTDLIQTLSREGIPIVGIPRTTDKVTRALDAIPYVASGNVFLPEDAPWLADFLDETSKFPNAKNDDQVDPLIDAIVDMLGVDTYNYEELL